VLAKKKEGKEPEFLALPGGEGKEEN